MSQVSHLITFAADNCQDPVQPEIWLTSSGVAFDSEDRAFYAEQIYFLLQDWQQGTLLESIPDTTFEDVQKAIAEILAAAYANT